jgi:hypothetical protein
MCRSEVVKLLAPRLAYALAPLVLALFACSSGAGVGADFPAAADATVTSSAGKLRVELRTAPSPAARGTDRVKLTMLDATSGGPVDGLTVTITPWMPAMGHGTSVKPTVIALGQGSYSSDDVALFMAGHWELRTTITGGIEDSATLAVDIP